jgi:hypothetical protein
LQPEYVSHGGKLFLGNCNNGNLGRSQDPAQFALVFVGQRISLPLTEPS